MMIQLLLITLLLVGVNLQFESAMQSDPISFEEHQLSQSFFQKCSDLALIEQPFPIETIAHQISSRDIESEFQLLRALTETKKHRLKLRVNSILQNKKNRYPEQSIYQHSRVILREQTDQNQDYINANYAPFVEDSRLIITQGPLEHTQQSFQKMIKQQNIQCVLMLCNVIENGKVRCFDYLQNRQRKMTQNMEEIIQITNVSLSNQLCYTHIHYSEWPDRGVPDKMEHMVILLRELLKYNRIVIHCSAGLGRSGVVAALLNLHKQIQKCGEASIFGVVRRLREHRFGAVQNNEQYRFIYSYLNFIVSELKNE